MIKHNENFMLILILGVGFSLFSSHPAQAQWNFVRGDKDGDGDVDVYDYYRFFSDDPGRCVDANDLNDNGLLENEDIHYLEDYLFNGGPPPLPPFPNCGPDPTPDALSCGYTTCDMKTFVRGDANCDGFINSQDSTFLESFLIGGSTPNCQDAADVDDDGVITDADIVYLSNYLNSAGPQPPPPFPTPCIDPTLDTLTCNSVCGIVPECADGIDNDGDAFTDYFLDCGCSSGCDSTEKPETQCNDGLDNDGDGKIDLSDCGCGNSCDNSELPLDECQDGIDNDGDGLIDLADTNCVNICDLAELFAGCTHRPCDVDGNGTWALTDIVGLVGVVYKGAAKPTPLCRTDCNRSGGSPTLTDIVYLVNKVFKGGPNPVPYDPCCR